jgi:protein phosphatase
MSLDGKLEIYGITDVGRKRSHNEDTIGSDGTIGVAVLADGMGGYKAGEVASAMAVNMVLEDLRQSLGRPRREEIDEETGFSRETLLVRRAIEKANRTIYTTAQSEPQCHGMGTTLVTVAFFDGRLTVAHIGDSRLYRMRSGVLEQITVDHSLLQELVDRGFYTLEEAKKSLNKNLVTRAMGIDPNVGPDLQEDVAMPGDIYLLCSDGLSDLVEHEQIESTLTDYGHDLEAAAKQLVQTANDKGGDDNISVILARTLKPFTAKKTWYSKVFD